MKLKVCGMRTEANIIDIAKAGVDYLGFIFYEGSPRYVGENFVIPETGSHVQKVGVFVNADVAEISRQQERLKLDLVQLHGDETPGTCDVLTAHGIRVIKVFSVHDDFDFSITRGYEGHVEYFLFDTRGDRRGGNARMFDWDILRRYQGPVPFFLSGGLNTDNAARARDFGHPRLYGIDVNSGAEIAAGFKDLKKVQMISEILNARL